MDKRENNNSTDYLQKFSYRKFEGSLEPRWMRVLHLIRFELVSTWKRSRFGKILIIIILVLNFAGIVGIASVAASIVDKELMRAMLNGFIASYLSWGDNFILPSTEEESLNFSMNLGILLIAAFGIAGSAYFADDKFGKVIEIYLSRLQKKEYIAGKIMGIILYINLFLMGPLLAMSILFVQAAEEDHLKYLNFYGGIVFYCLLTSLILGLFILSLSISVEKRSYASLIFFMTFLFGSIIGAIIALNDIDNEFLLLISPSNFLTLLAYVCLGDLNLGIFVSFDEIKELDLNNGSGLEYWHIYLQAIILILIFSTYLAIRIKRMTTEEL
ncbi:MAG: hypothetical protein GF383_02530 [Candidatus Lokiarchaeota archaeon]|nr:hypothetical protein [Candidatus Lokiarchaeota archaeon]MBD3338298.1 hypothetical protein [Candidatus Lokiarchaeota archaeon]